MRAAIIETIGSSPVPVQGPDPELLAEGQLLVSVGAAGLNPIDLLIASGKHPLGSPRVPYVPCVEGVGTVIAGGEQLDGARVRLQVPAGFADGTLAEVVRVNDGASRFRRGSRTSSRRQLAWLE
jgi:NADPH:quinone reductase-like Zn-dependent oxidoreductase